MIAFRLYFLVEIAPSEEGPVDQRHKRGHRADARFALRSYSRPKIFRTNKCYFGEGLKENSPH